MIDTLPSQWSSEWVMLPNGGAIHKDDLVPCRGCGGMVYWIPADSFGGVKCPGCLPPKQRPIDPRFDVLAYLDLRRRVITRRKP